MHREKRRALIAGIVAGATVAVGMAGMIANHLTGGPQQVTGYIAGAMLDVLLVCGGVAVWNLFDIIRSAKWRWLLCIVFWQCA